MEGGHNNYSSGLVWPQRNYTCSFCKRQFNSAQALGGHMNVHRRDRAMLIQLPSWVFDQFPNPNSNSKSQHRPNFSSSDSSTDLLPHRHYTHQYPFHLSSSSTSLTSYSSYGDKQSSEQLESSVPLYEDLTMDKKRDHVVEEAEFKRGHFGHEIEVLKQNEELISLDLEIGRKHSREVLDLELRLGCF